MQKILSYYSKDFPGLDLTASRQHNFRSFRTLQILETFSTNIKSRCNVLKRDLFKKRQINFGKKGKLSVCWRRQGTNPGLFLSPINTLAQLLFVSVPLRHTMGIIVKQLNLFFSAFFLKESLLDLRS